MEAWIGLAHIRPRPGNDLLGPAIGAFVPVVALAEDENDFASKAAELLSSLEFDVPEIQDIEPFQKRILHYAVDRAIRRQAESLSETDPIAYGTFNTYNEE